MLAVPFAASRLRVSPLSPDPQPSGPSHVAGKDVSREGANTRSEETWEDNLDSDIQQTSEKLNALESEPDF